MCFYADYDWYASVTEEEDCVSDGTIRCYECRRTVQAGTQYEHIRQQEHEECQLCQDGECECAEDKCCQCSKPTFGETFEANTCHDCREFRKAVVAVEKEAGCDGYESQPPFGDLIEDIREIAQHGDAADAERYFAKAAEMHPQLHDNGYLAWLRGQVFDDAAA